MECGVQGEVKPFQNRTGNFHHCPLPSSIRERERGVFETKPSLLKYLFPFSFLRNKVEGKPLPCSKAVTECDLYGTREPSEMFKDSMAEDSYYFAQLKNKSPKDLRILRTVGKKGSWKGQHKAVAIHDGKGELIGYKKVLLYKAKGSKNNPSYIMHEYQLPDVSQQSNEANGSRLNDYVLCRIKIKGGGGLRTTEANLQQQQGNDMPNLCDARPEPPLASQPLSPEIKEIKSAEADHLCPTAANLQQQQGNGMPIDIGALPEPPLASPLPPGIIELLEADAYYPCLSAENLQQQEGNGMTTNPTDAFSLLDDLLPQYAFWNDKWLTEPSNVGVIPDSWPYF